MSQSPKTQTGGSLDDPLFIPEGRLSFFHGGKYERCAALVEKARVFVGACESLGSE